MVMTTTQTVTAPMNAVFHRSSAVTALDVAIAKLTAARRMLELEDEQLAELQEEERYIDFDAELNGAVNSLQLLECALSAAGEDYFENELAGRYRIGCLVNHGLPRLTEVK